MANVRKGSASHAGGVVFRRSEGELEYLLVRARKPPDAWVFPKGHLEEGETPERAALREVLEEAGVHVSVVSSLGRMAIDSQYAAMFLMQYQSQANTPPERECAWLGLEAALQKLAFKESQDLLRAADRSARAAA